MITYHIFSGNGSREINEDFVEVRTENESALMIVADGLGGHSNGEVASRLVASTIAESFDFSATDVKKSLREGFEKAQRLLLEEQIRGGELEGMKTTAVVLLIKDKRVNMVHIGDSRGYVFFKSGVVRRTLDHSIPQLLALSGKIKEKEIRKHPQRSGLLRVFGIPWEREEYEFEPELSIDEVKAILLCSDGFWELIDERIMKLCLVGTKSAQDWLDKMRKVVEKNGKKKNMDNYSAVAVIIR